MVLLTLSVLSLWYLFLGTGLLIVLLLIIFVLLTMLLSVFPDCPRSCRVGEDCFFSHQLLLLPLGCCVWSQGGCQRWHPLLAGGCRRGCGAYATLPHRHHRGGAGGGRRLRVPGLVSVGVFLWGLSFRTVCSLFVWNYFGIFNFWF